MASQRAHILLPDDLVREIDDLAGTRGRSAFIVDAMRREVKRLRLVEFLNDPTPVWKDEDHPELKQGAAAWVRGIRRTKSSRQQTLAKKLAERK